jgi:hypothetical protein
VGALATDNFTRADGNDLGTAWDVQTGNTRFGIASNRAAPSALGSDCAENNNSATWPNDQYSKATIGSLTGGGNGTGSGIGVTCRAASGANTMYRAVGGTTPAGSEVGKSVAGSFTALFGNATTWAAGDVIEIRAVGTTISLYRNGSLVQSTTDSSIASGRPGVGYSSTVTAGTLSAWEGGDFAAGATFAGPKVLHSQAVRRAAFY